MIVLEAAILMQHQCIDRKMQEKWRIMNHRRYLMVTISSELKVLFFCRVWSFSTLIMEGLTWIVPGLSYSSLTVKKMITSARN